MKKIIFLFLLFTAFLFVVLFYIPLTTKLWKFYPSSIKVAVAWHKLENDFVDNKVCHEDCQANRRELYNVIAQFYDNHPAFLNNFVTKYYANEARHAVASQILPIFNSTSQELACQELLTYLKADSFYKYNAEIAKLCLNNSQKNNQWLSAFYLSFDGASEKQKEQLLQIIGLVDTNNIEFFASILSGDESENIKRKTLMVLSNISDKEDFLSLYFFDILKKELFNETNSLVLQDNILDFMSEYLNFNRELVVKTYEDVYNNSKFNDILRYNAAMKLKNITGNDYILPAIDVSNWDNYLKS